jgi:S1-C subfamily serine protease
VKRLGLVLSILLAGCFYPKVTPMERVANATEQVVVTGVFGGGTATAWWYEDGVAVTAGHVCAMENDALYEVGGRRAWVIASDFDRDVCVLGVEGEAPAVLRLATDPLTAGESVTYAGYPQGAWVVSEGRGSECEAQDDFGRPSACVTLPATWGSSGSAVVDASGRVVGLISQFYGYPGSPVVELATAEEVWDVLCPVVADECE